MLACGASLPLRHAVPDSRITPGLRRAGACSASGACCRSRTAGAASRPRQPASAQRPGVSQVAAPLRNLLSTGELLATRRSSSSTTNSATAWARQDDDVPAHLARAGGSVHRCRCAGCCAAAVAASLMQWLSHCESGRRESRARQEDEQPQDCLVLPVSHCRLRRNLLCLKRQDGPIVTTASGGVLKRLAATLEG